jgi:hypothetical protein
VCNHIGRRCNEPCWLSAVHISPGLGRVGAALTLLLHRYYTACCLQLLQLGAHCLASGQLQGLHDRQPAVQRPGRRGQVLVRSGAGAGQVLGACQAGPALAAARWAGSLGPQDQQAGKAGRQQGGRGLMVALQPPLQCNARAGAGGLQRAGWAGLPQGSAGWLGTRTRSLCRAGTSALHSALSALHSAAQHSAAQSHEGRCWLPWADQALRR